MLHKVGFFKGGFCCLQDVTFFEKLVPNYFKYFYIVRVNYIGPPGSSCLADVKTLWNKPLLEENFYHVDQRCRVSDPPNIEEKWYICQIWTITAKAALKRGLPTRQPLNQNDSGPIKTKRKNWILLAFGHSPPMKHPFLRRDIWR